MMMQRNWVWGLDEGFTCLWLSSIAHVYLTCVSAFASASAGEQYGYVDVLHYFAWLKLTYVFYRVALVALYCPGFNGR